MSAYPILAHLAEQSLQVANACTSNFLAINHTFRKTDPIVQRELYTAILALNAILKHSNEPLIQVRARLRLAEVYAEVDEKQFALDQLQKAMILASTMTDEEAVECRFRIISLQTQLDPGKTSLNLVKSTVKDILAVQQFDWYYHFQVLTAHTHDNPIHQISKLAEYAKDQKHYLMAVALYLDSASWSLNHGSLNDCFESLSQVATSFGHECTNVIPLELKQVQIDSNHPLYLQFAILYIFYCINKGDGKVAMNWMQMVQARMENNQKIQHLVDLPVPSPTKAYTYTLELLDQAQMVSLIWFLSGLTHKTHDASKASKYLEEALKSVDEACKMPNTREQLADSIAVRFWYRDLRLHILHHLVDCYLVRTDLSQAYTHLNRFTQHLAEGDDEKWQMLLCLNWGTYHQSKGEFDQAEKWLKGAASGIETEPFVGIVAMFNLILIYLSKGDVKKARNTLELIQDFVKDSTTMQAGLKGLQGATNYFSGEVHATKAEVLDCIRACDVTMTNQLKTLCLCILGLLFQATDTEKSEKIFTTCLALAKKAKQDGWVFVASDAMTKLVKDDKLTEYSNLAKASLESFQGKVRSG